MFKKMGCRVPYISVIKQSTVAAFGSLGY